MKIALWLTFFLSYNALSEELFQKATEADLMAVSFNFLEESKKVMSKVPEKDCDTNMSVGTVKEKESPSEGKEIFCLCELNGNEIKDKSLLNNLIGDYDSEFTINTGNDNFMHGALQKIGAKEYDGDDRGRTFSGGIDYKLLGTDGELKLSLDSTGFGKFSKVDGYRKSPDGKYYLNFRELNTVDLRLDKNFSKNESGKSYLITEFKFTNETDEGTLSRGVQEWWHTFNKKQMGMDVIQYRYLTEEPDRNTVSLMAGAGREWIKDIGNWKCQTRLEAKGGMSIDFKGNMSPEIAARAEGKISHSSLPWLALSTWVQGSGGYMGTSAEAGIMLSAEKKFKKVIVKPFIGIERHRTPMDKKFGEVSGKPYENYHVFGVTIKY